MPGPVHVGFGELAAHSGVGCELWEPSWLWSAGQLGGGWPCRRRRWGLTEQATATLKEAEEQAMWVFEQSVKYRRPGMCEDRWGAVVVAG